MLDRDSRLKARSQSWPLLIFRAFLVNHIARLKITEAGHLSRFSSMFGDGGVSEIMRGKVTPKWAFSNLKGSATRGLAESHVQVPAIIDAFYENYCDCPDFIQSVNDAEDLFLVSTCTGLCLSSILIVCSYAPSLCLCHFPLKVPHPKMENEIPIHQQRSRFRKQTDVAAVQLSFRLRTSSTVTMVHLLGSWDNYSG
jgi:hypothetical protein